MFKIKAGTIDAANNKLVTAILESKHQVANFCCNLMLRLLYECAVKNEYFLSLYILEHVLKYLLIMVVIFYADR